MPERPNETRSMYFMADQLTNGRSFRIFSVLDDFSRDGDRVDVSHSSEHITRVLDWVLNDAANRYPA